MSDICGIQSKYPGLNFFTANVITEIFLRTFQFFKYGGSVSMYLYVDLCMLYLPGRSDPLCRDRRDRPALSGVHMPI